MKSSLPVTASRIVAGLIALVLLDASVQAQIITQPYRTFPHGDGSSWCAADLSPDSTQVVTAGDGGAKLWDVQSSQLLRTFPTTDTLSGVAFAPNGSIFATLEFTNDDSILRLWSTVSDAPLNSVTWPGWAAWASPSFSPDGARLLLVGWSVTFVDNVRIESVGWRIWNVSTGDLLASVVQSNNRNWISSARFSADGREIITVGGTGDVPRFAAWDAITGELKRQFGAPGEWGVIQQDGSACATWISPNNTQTHSRIRLWDIATGRALQEVEIVPDAMTRPTYLLSGNLLVRNWGFMGIGEAQIWDLRVGGAPVCTILQPGAWLVPTGTSSDGRRLLTAGSGKVDLWDLSPVLDRNYLDRGRSLPDFVRTPLQSFGSGGGYSMALAASPDGTTLAVAGRLSTVLWDLATYRPTLTLQSSEDMDLPGGVSAESPWANTLTYSPDGTRLVERGGEGLRVWDAQNGALLRQFGAPFSFSRVAVSSNASEIIATTVSNSVLYVWEANSGHLMHALDHGPSPLYWSQVWLSCDGKLVASKASGYYDTNNTLQQETKIRLWDLSTGQLRHLLPVGSGGAQAVFSSDGTRVFTTTGEQVAGEWTQRLRVWNTASGQLTADSLLDPASWGDLAVSPDPTRFLFGGWLYDATTAALIRTLDHPDVNDVVFLPDGKTAITGSRDGTVKLWNAATGQWIRTLSLNPQPVLFASDGKAILIRNESDGAQEIDHWTGAELHEFTNYVDALLAGDFSSPYSSLRSPDGRQALRPSTDYEGLLDLCDVATSNVLLRVRGHISLCSFSPDGRFIATSEADVWNVPGTSWMTLWDAATGQSIRFLDDTAERLGFSPDGLLLVSEHDDGTVALWDLRDLVVGLRVVTTAQGRELRWEQGRLQEADSITGPWRDAWNASSPLRLGGAAPQKFYRVVAH